MELKNYSLKFCLFLFVVNVCVNAQTPNYVPSNGLIGWWSFSGNANDLSGNNNHGIVNGATLTADRFGNTDSAYDFLSNNNVISVPTVVETNITKYSVAGWFKKNTSSSNSEGNIFCGSNPCAAPGGLRFHIGSTNQAAFGAEFQSCSSVWSYSQNNNYSDGQWHSFAIIFDSEPGLITTNQLNIYIDGVYINQAAHTQGDTNNVIAPINNQGLATLFGNVPGGGDNFKGTLDDIGIWNRTLTQTEITQLSTSTLGLNSIVDSSPLNIYPNPVKDYLIIDCSDKINYLGCYFQLINIVGQVVISQDLSSQQHKVMLDRLSDQGLYFIKIFNHEGKLLETKKIILQ